jgi:anion-transporting  ArsA/GET3 family ATPase
MAKNQGQEHKKTVHITLQGKGGVGKSFASVMLAQYLQQKSEGIKCIDTDPINQTFHGYKALNVEFLKLINDNTKSINSRVFDGLMERLFNENDNFVVDNGASSFIPLTNYLIENNAIQMLHDAGRDVVIHTIVTGGQAFADTLKGFAELVRQPSIKKIIVWINEFFGEVEAQGKTFTDMKVYVENADKVGGIVKIARLNQDTYAKDIEQMIVGKLTFSEALESPEFTIMARQRLKNVRDDIYRQLAGIGL